MPLPGEGSLAQSPSQRAEVPWLSGDGNSHTGTENRAAAQESSLSTSQNEGPGCISECTIECKALTMPPFHLKSSKGCNFYYPRYITLQCAEAASKTMPEKCKAVERGKPVKAVSAQPTTQPSWLLSASFWHRDGGNRMGQPSKEHNKRAKLRKTDIAFTLQSQDAMEE